MTIKMKGVFSSCFSGGSVFMAEKPSDLVQGTLDMLILKTLALEPMHGYGVAVRIEQISNGVFHVNAGSLFVAFQRLLTSRVDQKRVESHREQQASKVLRFDGARTKAAEQRNARME
jgi:PadR family transcriptional regulator, regulatory protein PadR